MYTIPNLPPKTSKSGSVGPPPKLSSEFANKLSES